MPVAAMLDDRGRAIETVTATEAKNAFGRVLDTALARGGGRLGRGAMPAGAPRWSAAAGVADGAPSVIALAGTGGDARGGLVGACQRGRGREGAHHDETAAVMGAVDPGHAAAAAKG